jgi:uncharacterized protein (DUF885 family)
MCYDPPMRRLFIAAAIIWLLTSSLPGQQPNVNDFFTDFTDRWMRSSPDSATAARYFKGEEQDRLERDIDPQTLGFAKQRIELARQGLGELSRFDGPRLTDSQRLSRDVMHWQLESIVQGEAYLDYTFPLQQMTGANVDLIETLTVRHPLQTPRDAENYVAALGQVGTRMDEAITEARRLETKNFLPPKFILNATIKQMQSFADPLPAQNPFVTVLDQKMSAIKDLPESRRNELRKQAESIVAMQVYPAWKRGIALLESQLPRATDDAGIWRLKAGAEAYAYFLHRFTTTNLTPAQIHEIGLKRVSEIEARMDLILKQMGRTEGTVKERIKALQTEMQYPNPTSEASRAQIMHDIDGILKDAQRRSATMFDVVPKAPIVAQPFPTFREANAAANYNVPTSDGSRPGTFQYPRRLSNMTKFGLRSIVYHETVPGHHFQLALEVEDKSLPRFRQVRAFGPISAYNEGWGLYAEWLAADAGWYEGDQAGLLGQLNYELFRARRLVVDTGLHAMHWTRQQAIDFGVEPSEVERYVVFPGQACSYMIGELKIIELRQKAKQALGNKFSLPKFHDVVLETGTVPLDLLERRVGAYIQANRGS